MHSPSELRDAKSRRALLVIVGIALLAGGVHGVGGGGNAILACFVFLIVGGIGSLFWQWVAQRQWASEKKFGSHLVVASLVISLMWPLLHAPPQWMPKIATVTAIDGPSATTETDYEYHSVYLRDGMSRDSIYRTTQMKTWSRLSEANSFRATPTVVYFDPSDPKKVRFDEAPEWVSVTAMPKATKVRKTGEATVTLQFSNGFGLKSATTTTNPYVARYKVGTTLPIWVDPRSGTRVSFRQLNTEGGQEYWLLALALILGLRGIGALVACVLRAGPSVPPPLPVQPPPLPRMNFRSAPPRETRQDCSPRLHRPAAAPPPLPTPVITENLIPELMGKIDWFQFEKVTARILESNGWRVDRRGGAGPDGGVDIIATKAELRAVVQCKHWPKKQVVTKTIREFNGAWRTADFEDYNCAHFFCGFDNYTADAAKFAHDNKITFWGPKAIHASIASIGSNRFPELMNPLAKCCPKCDSRLLRLNVPSGRTEWKCSNRKCNRQYDKDLRDPNRL
jgi:hypothetical protein